MKNKRLLLVRTDAIGDYILFRNFIEVLSKSKKYNSYKIDILCHISWHELSIELDKNFISNFYSFDTARFKRDEWYKFSLLEKLNLNTYEVIIHSTFSRTFNMDKLISEVNAKEKIGSLGDNSNISEEEKTISDNFYTKLIDNTEPKYKFEFDRNKDFFIKLLDDNVIQNTFLSIDFKANNINIPFDNYIIISLGANTKKRKWNPINYAKVGTYLNTFGYEIILCGGEKELLDSYIFDKNFDGNYINLVGKTSLIDLISLVKNAYLTICNDTGIGHISAALNTKTIIISNFNHFTRFVPYPNKYLDIYTICPYNFTTKLNHYQKEYYNNSDLDINLITIKNVISFLDINLKLKQIKNNTKVNYNSFKFSRYRNDLIDFSEKFNNLFHHIHQYDENIVLYGYGVIGQTIHALIPNKIIGFVDINDSNNHPLNLKNMKYDKILITVLGREEEIIKYLSEELNINKNKIIIIEI